MPSPRFRTTMPPRSATTTLETLPPHTSEHSRFAHPNRSGVQRHLPLPSTRYGQSTTFAERLQTVPSMPAMTGRPPCSRMAHLPRNIWSYPDLRLPRHSRRQGLSYISPIMPPALTTIIPPPVDIWGSAMISDKLAWALRPGPSQTIHQCMMGPFLEVTKYSPRPRDTIYHMARLTRLGCFPTHINP